MAEWTSLLNGLGEGYGIGPLPDRKRVCLYRWLPERLLPIAYFHDEDEARQFLEFLIGLSRARTL